MEEQKLQIKTVIKEEVSKLTITFPNKEEFESEDEYTDACLDVLHDTRENFDWERIQNTIKAYNHTIFDDYIYEQLWEELLLLLP